MNRLIQLSSSQSGFFNLRVLIGLFVVLAGVFLALFGTSATERTRHAAANLPRFRFRPATAGSAQIKPVSGVPTGTAQWVWQNPLPQGNALYIPSFTDANTGTAVGDNGTIVRTIDGGNNWIIQSSGTTNALLGVSFADADHGTAVGASGTIVKTTDGGNNWVSQTSGTTNALEAVSFTDVNTGTVVGELGIVLRTTDGWRQHLGQPNERDQRISFCSFVYRRC